MLEPYTHSSDAAVIGGPSIVAAIARQRQPDASHPLAQIRCIVDRTCVDAPRAQAYGGYLPQARVDQRVVRAAILQALYSFACNELLIEHLRYNSLYRWFARLRDGEHPWSAASYADALTRLLSSDEGAGILRTSLLQAVSCASRAPDRFCIDRGLVDRWSLTPRAPSQAEPPTTSGHGDRCRARLERARDIILRRLGDASLTPESIADEMCMSRRALFLLFEKQGLTPTRVIRDLRLDHCRSLLIDSRHRHRKITDIAMDHGFTHAGTFSRQFKDRFGLSPVDLRASEGLAPRRSPLPRFPGYAAEAAG